MMPTMQIVQVKVSQLICLSVAITSESQANDQALSRQASSIWDDDETDRNTDDVIPW